MAENKRPRIENDPDELVLNRQFVMTDTGRIDKIRDLYTTYNPEVDVGALKAGGYIRAVGKMMEPVTLSLDDHSPSVLAYWARLGMVKEFHGEDVPMSWTEYVYKTGYHWSDVTREGPQNNFKKWNSFVPVSAFRPENAGRKYPAVVALHGGFNPISIIDGWGWVQEAARREWIVIVPSVELDDIIEEILNEAKTLYPIDEERVYACGFSYGGFMANLLGNKRPDIFAAVAPCGAPISNGFCDEAVGPAPQLPFDGKPRALQLGIYMPVINICGNLDGHRFPIYDFKGFFSGAATAGELVEGINSWARVNRAKEISFSDVTALKLRDDLSAEEKNIGIPLEPDCRETIERDGLVHYIGGLKSEDGVVRVKLMCTMNMSHWPTPEMSRQAFEFFSRFSRDARTKESVYRA